MTAHMGLSLKVGDGAKLGAPIGKGILTINEKTRLICQLDWPELSLFCPNDDCVSGEPTRWDRMLTGASGSVGDRTNYPSGFTTYWEATYRCRACGKSEKRYWLRVKLPEKLPLHVTVTKVGEDPGHVHQVPSKILRDLGKEKDLLFKGMASENVGCGIGAYAYYRRIVENLKLEFLKKLADVAVEMGAEAEEVHKLLTDAGSDNRFSRAVEDTKQLITDATFDGCCDNLLLLHGITSAEMHGGTDENASGMAADVRVLLIGLLTKIGTIKNKGRKRQRRRSQFANG